MIFKPESNTVTGDRDLRTKTIESVTTIRAHIGDDGGLTQWQGTDMQSHRGCVEGECSNQSQTKKITYGSELG